MYLSLSKSSIFQAKNINFATAMEKRKKIWFIINPISGTKDKQEIVQLIPRYMDEARFEYVTMYFAMSSAG